MIADAAGGEASGDATPAAAAAAVAAAGDGEAVEVEVAVRRAEAAMRVESLEREWARQAVKAATSEGGGGGGGVQRRAAAAVASDCDPARRAARRVDHDGHI